MLLIFSLWILFLLLRPRPVQQKMGRIHKVSNTKPLDLSSNLLYYSDVDNTMRFQRPPPARAPSAQTLRSPRRSGRGQGGETKERRRLRLRKLFLTSGIFCVVILFKSITSQIMKCRYSVGAAGLACSLGWGQWEERRGTVVVEEEPTVLFRGSEIEVMHQVR